MGEEDQPMHFGLNCRLLKRDQYAPADWRCAAAIERYADPAYGFLDTQTSVSLQVASRILALSEDDVVRRAKSGEMNYFYPENVAKRITILTKTGQREVTITEAAKRMKVSKAELERQILAGEIKADYPDEFMHVVLITRWDYEKCPLVESGGICSHYQPHDGPKIRCLADAGRYVEGKP